MVKIGTTPNRFGKSLFFTNKKMQRTRFELGFTVKTIVFSPVE
jgi:hypothetical protein